MSRFHVFIVYRQTYDGYVRNHGIASDLIREEGIESMGRTQIYTSVGSLEDAVGDEMTALQTIARREHLNVSLGIIPEQPLSGSYPEYVMILYYSADVGQAPAYVHTSEQIGIRVIETQAGAGSEPYGSLAVNESAVYIVARQGAFCISMPIALPFSLS